MLSIERKCVSIDSHYQKQAGGNFMRKRFWLFALLLALCLVLTGCRKTVSAPPAAPGSTFAAAPANDAPATVADFDAALKAAGFIKFTQFTIINTFKENNFPCDILMYLQHFSQRKSQQLPAGY